MCIEGRLAAGMSRRQRDDGVGSEFGAYHASIGPDGVLRHAVLGVEESRRFNGAFEHARDFLQADYIGVTR